MADLQIRIKSKAELTAIKDTEKAIRGVGETTKKTAKEIAELTRNNYLLTSSSQKVTRETEKQAKETKKAGDEAAATEGKFKKFAGSLKTQIFGSLVSFALVTKAVNALRATVAPVLGSVSQAITSLGTAWAEYAAQSQAAKNATQEITSIFQELADTIKAVNEANKEFTPQVNTNLESRIDVSNAPEALRKRFEEFQSAEAAQAAFDQRKIADVDRSASEKKQILTAQGKLTPTVEAEIDKQARAQKASILQESQRSSLQRLAELQGEVPSEQRLLQGVEAFREAESGRAAEVRLRTVINRLDAREELARSQSPALVATYEKRGIFQRIQDRRTKLQAELEAAINKSNTSTTRFRDLEKEIGFGVTTAEDAQKVGQLGADFITAASQNLTRSGNQISTLEASSRAEAAFSQRITPILQNNANLEQAKQVASERNQLEQELLGLLQQGIPQLSETVSALQRAIAQLNQREKGLRE